MIVQLMTAFFLSALMHTGGDYAIHRSFGKSGPTLQFFLLQPAAIVIEEITIHSVRWVCSSTRFRIPTLVWRGVGYLWVGLWFAWCTPPWLDVISGAGGNIRTRLIPLKAFSYPLPPLPPLAPLALGNRIHDEDSCPVLALLSSLFPPIDINYTAEGWSCDPRSPILWKRSEPTRQE